MTHLERIIQYATDRGITILHGPIGDSPAMVVRKRGKLYIVVDPAIATNDAIEAAAIAHELGHIETGTIGPHFRHNPDAEDRAWAWAIHELLPKDTFAAARFACQGKLWEMIEMLNLPDYFIEKASVLYNCPLPVAL